MRVFCEVNYIGIPLFRSTREDDKGLTEVPRYLDMPRPLHSLYELAFFQVPSIWVAKLIWSKPMGEYGMLIQPSGADEFPAYKAMQSIKNDFLTVRFGPSEFLADHEIFVPARIGRNELARFLSAINRAKAGEFDSAASYADGIKSRLSTTLTPSEITCWLDVAKRMRVRRPFGAGIRESMLTKGVFHVAFHHTNAPNVQWDTWDYRSFPEPSKDLFIAAVGKQALEDYYGGDTMKFARALKKTLEELLNRDVGEEFHPGKDSEYGDGTICTAWKVSSWRVYVQQTLCAHAYRVWKPYLLKSSAGGSLPVSPAFIIEV